MIADTASAPPPRCRRVMRRVQVTRVAQLSPCMVHVTSTGDDDHAGLGKLGAIDYTDHDYGTDS